MSIFRKIDIGEDFYFNDLINEIEVIKNGKEIVYGVYGEVVEILKVWCWNGEKIVCFCKVLIDKCNSDNCMFYDGCGKEKSFKCVENDELKGMIVEKRIVDIGVDIDSEFYGKEIIVGSIEYFVEFCRKVGFDVNDKDILKLR